MERGRHQLVRDYSIIERIYLYDGHTYLLLKYVYDRYVPTVYRTLWYTYTMITAHLLMFITIYSLYDFTVPLPTTMCHYYYYFIFLLYSHVVYLSYLPIYLCRYAVSWWIMIRPWLVNFARLELLIRIYSSHVVSICLTYVIITTGYLRMFDGI